MIKRTLVSLLALVLSISMIGCQSKFSNNAVATPQKETIELNSNNFKQFFFVEPTTKNYLSKEVNLLGYLYESGTADCSINISKKVQCAPENVSITLEIKSYTLNWDDEVKQITINIPVDGGAEKTISFQSESTVSGLLTEPTFSYTIISVSGTVTVDK